MQIKQLSLSVIALVVAIIIMIFIAIVFAIVFAIYIIIAAIINASAAVFASVIAIAVDMVIYIVNLYWHSSLLLLFPSLCCCPDRSVIAIVLSVSYAFLPLSSPLSFASPIALANKKFCILIQNTFVCLRCTISICIFYHSPTRKPLAMSAICPRFVDEVAYAGR